jgi:hypothetical protein
MLSMTKKTYRKHIVGHLQWSAIGLFIALAVAFVASDHRFVVYGVPAAESAVSEVTGIHAPATSFAPAFRLRSVTTSAPGSLTPRGIEVVPDTINGELVWPDPWDKITNFSRRNY